MKKIKVGVAGYGVIGQRLADGVALQEDMELVGVADIAPTLSIRALKERGVKEMQRGKRGESSTQTPTSECDIPANAVRMPYDLYLVDGADKESFDALEIPTKGSFRDLIGKVDVMLDSAPGGIGVKNKALYEAAGVKAVFQGGEANSVADVFFHGCANYEKGLNADYLKLTSCNTTGLIRAVDCLDRAFGVDRVAITIIRRVADPGDYHRGLTNALQMEKAPSHQALDLMTVMPHIDATGILVHTPVTHGHIITVLAHGKDGAITKEQALTAFRSHPRIRVVNMAQGFLGNASFFRYARDLGNPRGDMYEIGLWEDSVVQSGDNIMFAINIPQESVTIPETIDAVRACMGLQKDSLSGTSATNKYLNME